MRILQVIQDLRPGGAERVALSLIEGAVAGGHTVAVAAAPGPWSTEFHCEQFELPLIERRPARIPGGALRLRRAVRRFAPDVVHAHNPGMGVIASLATLRGRRPAMVSVHGVPEADYRATARVLGMAGIPVIACGPGVAAALGDHGLAVRATVVNGVSPPPVALLRTDVCEEFGLDPDRRLVVSVGRLVPQKRHDLTIAALATEPSVSLLIVGGGPLDGELAAQIHEIGAEGRMVLTGSRSDARSILGAADAAVLASDWEGLPLVALEAMAGGVPFVGTAVRGIRELVHDGVDALLAPPDDPSALAATLRRVLDDPDLAAQLQDAGQTVAARYSEAAMVNAFLALYDEMSA